LTPDLAARTFGAEMDTSAIVVGIVIVVLSGVVMSLLVKGQRKKAEAAFAMLAARGPMTLDELTAATGTNFVMKGYLMQALDGLASEGKLEKIAPPAGHPRLRILRDTKYGLPAARGVSS
jgi:hypothetical protein